MASAMAQSSALAEPSDPSTPTTTLRVAACSSGIRWPPGLRSTGPWSSPRSRSIETETQRRPGRRPEVIRLPSCPYFVSRGSAKNRNSPLGDDGSRDIGQPPRIRRSTRALSLPHVSLPDREHPLGYVKVQLKIGIEVWTIEHLDFSIQRHPQRKTQTMGRIPATFHKSGVTAACLEPGGNGQQGWSDHTASKSFGVANELSTLVVRLDLLAAEGSPPSRPRIEYPIDLHQRGRLGVSPEDGHGKTGVRAPLRPQWRASKSPNDNGR